VVAIAERHLDDPGGIGLAGYFWEIGELLATHRGLVGHLWNVPDATPIIARSWELQGRLLADAQHHDLARSELTAEDLAAWSLQGVPDSTRGLPVNAWQRHLEILLAGLATASRPLHNRALTPREMDTVIRAAPDSSNPSRKRLTEDGDGP
jgi:hypothetical protein